MSNTTVQVLIHKKKKKLLKTKVSNGGFQSNYIEETFLVTQITFFLYFKEPLAERNVKGSLRNHQ